MPQTARFPFFPLLLLLLNLLPALAAPFTVSPSTPQDAQPGVNVLVFVLGNPGLEPLAVTFTVSAPGGVVVLAAPEAVTVPPGEQTLVPVTVLTSSTLRAGEACVKLTATSAPDVNSAEGVLLVAQRRAVTLVAPASTAGGSLTITARNDGNAPDDVNLTLAGTGRDTVAPATAGPFTLQPGEGRAVDVSVQAIEPGAVVVNAKSTGGASANALVRVTPDAAAAPIPYRLAGSLDLAGPWPLAGGLALSGALSDEMTFDARLSASSFGSLVGLANFNWFGFKPFGATAVTSVSVGLVGDDALGAGLGVQGWGARVRLSLLQSPNALGSLGAAATSGGSVVALGGRLGPLQGAVAFGVSANGFGAGVTVSTDSLHIPLLEVEETTRARLTLNAAGGTSGEVSANFTAPDTAGLLNASFNSDAALFIGSFSRRFGPTLTGLQASLTSNGDFSSVVSFRLENLNRLGFNYPGLQRELAPGEKPFSGVLTLDQTTYVGANGRVGLRLGYSGPFFGGLTVQAGVFGAVITPDWGLDVAVNGALGGQSRYGLSARLDSGSLDLGGVVALVNVPLDGGGPAGSLDLNGALDWRLPFDSVSSLGLNLNGTWRHENLDLRAQVGVSVSGRAVGGSVNLGGTWRFGLDVPEAVTQLAGGRREAVVQGAAYTEQAGRRVPLAGARVTAGEYSTTTGPDGEFRLRLPPGGFDLRLEPNSPTLIAPQARPLNLKAHDALTVTLLATSAAAVHLTAEAAPGVAGLPLDGVSVTFSTSALAFSVTSDASGEAHAGSLPPGRYLARLSGLPAGLVGAIILEAPGVTTGVASQAQGELSAGPTPSGEAPSGLSVDLQPGETLSLRVTLNYPPTSGAILDASVSVTPDGALPPGASPIVKVHVEGGADRLSLQVGDKITLFPGTGPDWTFRLPIPATAEDAWAFTVLVTRGAEQLARQVILPLTPGPLALVTLTPFRGPAGAPVTVTATVLAAATGARLTGPNLNASLTPATGLEWRASFTAPGGWTGRTTLTLIVTTDAGTFSVPVVFIAP